MLLVVVVLRRLLGLLGIGGVVVGVVGVGKGEVQVGKHARVDQRCDPPRALLVEGQPLAGEEFVVGGGGGAREEVHGEGVLEGYAGVEGRHGDACPLGERGKSWERHLSMGTLSITSLFPFLLESFTGVVSRLSGERCRVREGLHVFFVTLSQYRLHGSV
ncbi:uncharacterized protein B0H64DRAFT_399530 [Chaetomium fimeti]|uniref:Uncharacterized protein n=1 Tax=Chaetomium fimeti TaxID=1854472 RepID=A0AAE0HCW8_9PEZI|nr:hypothetical protein B0H64DRAFT_399530 [Chaetomium fimeti]